MSATAADGLTGRGKPLLIFGLRMALNAGCPSVAVSYGAHEPDGFHALQPLYVAHSVPDLHRWLLENA